VQFPWKFGEMAGKKEPTDDELLAIFKAQLAEPPLIVTSAKDATKPLMHVVFVKMKASVSPDELALMEHDIKDLRYKIPGIVNVFVGQHDTKVYEGYVDRSKGFTHVITYVFTDGNALKEFGPHKDHVRVKDKFIVPNAETIAAADYFEPTACTVVNSAVEAKSAPLVHIVVFKVKRDVSAEVKAQMKSEFEALPKKIPGLMSLVFNATDTKVFDGFVDRTQGYTHILYSFLADAKALLTYTNHEAHVSAKARLITPNVEDIFAIDFTLPRAKVKAAPLEFPPPPVVG